MKTIRLVVRQAEISREFPNGLELQLEDDASTIDTIKAADRTIVDKCGKFPVKGFKNLFQMVYYPYENRFYNQVAVQAYTKTNLFLNIRENPELPVPNDTTIVLIPEGGCSTDWEEPIK